MDQAMDVDLLRPEADTITNFATGAPLVLTSRPKPKPLKEVLIANGASSEMAEGLASPAVAFIPVMKKKQIAFACKGCGRKHPKNQICVARVAKQWAETVTRTGWESIFSSWKMQGWVLNLDQSAWNHGRTTTTTTMHDTPKRSDRVLRSMKDGRKANPNPSSLAIVTGSGIKTVDFLADCMASSDMTPVWTSRGAEDTSRRMLQSATDRKDGRKLEQREELESCLAEKRAARIAKSKLRKAKKEAAFKNDTQRYLKLHNSLNARQLSLDDVKTKFARRSYTLRGEVEGLQRQQCDNMIDDFAGVAVKDDADKQAMVP